MLGEIRIERGAPSNTRGVMLDHFFERLEASIVHVWPRQLDVAQRRHSEFALVPVAFGRVVPARVFELCIQAVVRKALALEQRPTMAMEAIRAELLAARVVFLR